MFDTSTNFDFDDDLNVKATSESQSRNTITKNNPLDANKSKTLPPEEIFQKPKTINPNTSVNVLKRKFPGPAGILPNCKNLNLSSFEIADNKLSSEIPCTQTSLSVFESAAWLRMKRDYEDLSDIFNIQWIKTKAKLNKLINQKAPFLGAVIQNIDSCGGPVAVITLKDRSGEIEGTIINNLFHEYSDDLTIGSVLVLRQFTVITTGPNLNNHSLTITLNNLVCIYSKSKNEDGDEIKIINVQNLDLPTLCDNKLSENSDIFEFEDNAEIDELERVLIDCQRKNDDEINTASKKTKFNFKKNNNNVINKSFVTTLSCSQVSVKTTNLEDAVIWEDVLDGVDADALFDDF